MKVDNRAISENNFKKLLPDGELSPFVTLVKNHSELEFCFRGNSGNEVVDIYYNNHIVFDVEMNGNVNLSFDHARYYSDWKSSAKKLKDFGFDNFVINKGKSSLKNVKRLVSKTKSFLTADDVETIYTDILKPIYMTYFEACGKVNQFDFFKQEGCVEQSSRKVPSLVEKKTQHELFAAFKTTVNGYFFYDMEFSKPHKNIEENRNDTNKNEPDMLAIKFDCFGNPEKLVFVEVKCTKAAWNGDSGIGSHISKMKAYSEDKESLDARRKEAYDIMSQYAKLGLRGLNFGMEFHYDDFSILEPEILIVLTDEARRLWNSSKAIDDVKFEAKKYESKEFLNADFYVII